MRISPQFLLWKYLFLHINVSLPMHPYLKDSNTRQRWFLWKKCRNNCRQWYLSSGSAALSFFKNSNSLSPVLCLQHRFTWLPYMKKLHLYTKVKIYNHLIINIQLCFVINIWNYYYEQRRPDKNNNNEQTNSYNARKFAETTRLARDILTSSHCFW